MATKKMFCNVHDFGLSTVISAEVTTLPSKFILQVNAAFNLMSGQKLFQLLLCIVAPLAFLI